MHTESSSFGLNFQLLPRAPESSASRDEFSLGTSRAVCPWPTAWGSRSGPVATSVFNGRRCLPDRRAVNCARRCNSCAERAERAGRFCRHRPGEEDRDRVHGFTQGSGRRASRACRFTAWTEVCRHELAAPCARLVPRAVRRRLLDGPDQRRSHEPHLPLHNTRTTRHGSATQPPCRR